MAYPKYNRKSIPAYYDPDRKEKEEGKAEPTYPWIGGSADLNGATKTVYADPSNFEKSFVENFFHSAAFETQENSDDDKKGLKNSLSHETRGYASGGVSATADGHGDEAHLDQKGSKRRNFAGDDGTSTRHNRYSGSGETSIGGSRSGGYKNHNGDTYKTTTGKRISEHKGDTHRHHEGDETSSTTGNKMVKVKGEYGLHAQGGNMDLQVDSGKLRLKTVGDTMTIDSSVKIVIQVGSSSMTLEPGQITIRGSAVKFEQA